MRLADCMDRATMAFGVSRAEITGPSRLDKIVQARHAVMLWGRWAGFSHKQIGYAVGREWSTVRDGVRSAKRRMDRDREYAAVLGGVAGRADKDWLIVGLRSAA